MALGHWSAFPAWQNFSSLFREACAAVDAPTNMEKSHHLTASLYFGIAALEAFLNLQMRLHLAPHRTPDEIFERLRRSYFRDKLTSWPDEICGRTVPIPDKALESIWLFNDVRGDLTHPKSVGPDIYERLFELEPGSVVDAVAQYIVAFHEARETHYPYWIFGWNYLNPRRDSHEIMLINEQQFCHSLSAIGFDVPAFDFARAAVWQDRYLTGLKGYRTIRDALDGAKGCEPKIDRFPYQPKLCRRWWAAEHQQTCGRVSPELLAAALRLDRA